jgi:hypothetical protein
MSLLATAILHHFARLVISKPKPATIERNYDFSRVHEIYFRSNHHHTRRFESHVC